jgi:hypothetical protein
MGSTHLQKVRDGRESGRGEREEMRRWEGREECGEERGRLCCHATHLDMADTMIDADERDLPQETECASSNSTRPQGTAHPRPFRVTNHIKILRFDPSLVERLIHRWKMSEKRRAKLGRPTVRINPTT